MGLRDGNSLLQGSKHPALLLNRAPACAPPPPACAPPPSRSSPTPGHATSSLPSPDRTLSPGTGGLLLGGAGARRPPPPPGRGRRPPPAPGGFCLVAFWLFVPSLGRCAPPWSDTPCALGHPAPPFHALIFVFHSEASPAPPEGPAEPYLANPGLLLWRAVAWGAPPAPFTPACFGMHYYFFLIKVTGKKNFFFESSFF